MDYKSKLFIDLPWEDICYFSGYMKTLSMTTESRRPNHAALEILCQNAKALRKVNFKKSTGVTNAHLISLFKNNHDMRSVNLSYCEGELTSACLQPLIVYCKNLTALDLSGCNWLTAECMETFAYHQKNLKCLNLSTCNGLEGGSVSAVIASCKRLETLNLSQTVFVTSQVLAAIAHHSTELQYLNLCHCCFISMDGLIPVLESCKKLKSLIIHESHTITRRGLARYKDKVLFLCPKPSLCSGSNDCRLR